MENKGINVLSLFDGMSCGQIALSKLGIKVNNYYASETDKHAIAVTKSNFPNTKHIGSVVDVNGSGLQKIDLLIGCSPCQGFSINGKGLNFEDERSKLFFEFVRLKNECNPKYWLLENVATMSSEIKLKIDEYLGMEGVLVNSNCFSAQNRKRFYWTNIPFEKPDNICKEFIYNILEEEDKIDNKLYWSKDKLHKQNIFPTETDGVITINPKMFNGQQTYQQDRVYNVLGKFPALTATLGNRFNILIKVGLVRKLTIREQARLQTIPEAYRFESISELQASKCIGNGWTVDVITHIFNHLAYP